MKKELSKRGYKVDIRDDLSYFELESSLEHLTLNTISLFLHFIVILKSLGDIKS